MNGQSSDADCAFLAISDIGNEGGKALAAAFTKGAMPGLEELRLSGNSLGDEALSALAPSLAYLLKIRELNLDDNLIEDDGVLALAHAVRNGWLKTLRLLALDDNMITDVGASAIGKAAVRKEVLPVLEDLDLDGNEIGKEGFNEFASALVAGGMPSLKIFDVDPEMIDHPSLKAICDLRGISVK